MQPWSIKDISPQQGKRALVTGANSGLGYETALGLARSGAEVIVTGRSQDKGRAAIERIQQEAASAHVRFAMLDLASLDSVRAFATMTVADGRPLDLLVNNAGVMAYPTRRLTADGFEQQFGTNHLGHFALTGLLLPALRKAAAPRVVNVSSLAHRGGKIDFSNLQAERKYVAWAAYQQSKLANLLFTLELQRRSDLYGWGLLSVAAHPGFARTNIITNGPGGGGMRGMVAGLVGSLISHSAADGALPILFAATDAHVTPVGYYGPDGFYELKGAVGPAKIRPQAKDQTVAQKLWQVSEQLTGVHWPEETA